jgi:broad specificity phosphatase PhoE
VFRGRVVAALDRIIERHQGQRVAVVAHGGVIGAYTASVLGIHRTMWMAVENTSVTLVRMSKAHGAHIVSVNDCHHLYDPAVGAST